MSSQRPAVLIVDDEQSITDFLAEGLAEEGYHCLTAFTGEEALEKLSRDYFDIALLDLNLPGISGLDVLREAILTYPRIAFIVVTASGDAQTAVEAMKLGATDYITKPFELERVNGSIEAVLQTKAIKKTAPEVAWMQRLDAIAEGVETRLDSHTGHVMSMAVIGQTVNIARQMEIPQGHIDEWVEERRQRFERLGVLDALLTMEPAPNS